jgi:excisionase family DNA binding protein
MVEPLYSIESAAKNLSLSPWTIRAYIRQGKIKPVRIGRRVLLTEAEIRRLIEHGLRDREDQHSGSSQKGSMQQQPATEKSRGEAMKEGRNN